MSKNIKCRLRAIDGTRDECRRLGLFPYQDLYHGARLFAVYHGHYFVEAFPSLSSAKRFVKSHIDFSYARDLNIVRFEAK